MINGVYYLDPGTRRMFTCRMTLLRRNPGLNQTVLWFKSTDLVFEHVVMMIWA